MSNPEFFQDSLEVDTQELAENTEVLKKDKPIDALVVFGFGVVSDKDLENMEMGKSIMGHPESGWRLPIGAKLRMQAAAELFEDNQVEDLILTGGSVKQNEGIDASEAQLMKNYLKHTLERKWTRKLKEEGNNEEEILVKIEELWQEAEPHILLEDKATNTIENFAHTINYLEEYKEKYQNIGLLSNDFHIERITKLANKMGVEGQGMGSEALIQESDLDPRLKEIDQKYFGPENKDFRQNILSEISSEDEHQRDVVEARLGTSLEDYQKNELKWIRGLDQIPEYWLPNVKFIKDPEQLKRILQAESGVQEVLAEHGVSNIENASYEELIEALNTVDRKLPPKEWEKPSVKIDLVRHGQSFHNAAKPAYFAGGSKEHDLGLIPSGINTAKELAEELKLGEKIDMIIHSDMVRSRETAEIIADNIGYPVELAEIKDGGLREVNVGSFAGKTRDQIREFGTDEEREALEAFASGDITKINFPNGENYESASERIRNSLEQIIENYGNKLKILIVGHGNTNKVILSILFPDESDFIRQFDSAHSKIIEMEVGFDGNKQIDFDKVSLLGAENISNDEKGLENV